MSVLCCPSLIYPENKVTQDDIVLYLDGVNSDNASWPKVRKMIQNTEVEERYMILPLDELTVHTGMTHRGIIYEKNAREMSIQVARTAIQNAGMNPTEIKMVIVTSCTGFMMPSLTAHLINQLSLRPDTVQLPIAQMGCAAGVSAINRAFDFSQRNKNNHVLMVSVEFSSLCYQPDDKQLHSSISASLFGDAVSGCVMRADDAKSGFAVKKTFCHTLPDSENYIKYLIKETGFHFVLDKAVMHSIKTIAPVIDDFNLNTLLRHCSENDFLIFHTGGRRILDELVTHLNLAPGKLIHSRESLKKGGNVASVVVFDVLRRHFEIPVRNKSVGIIAAFGPGFTTEMACGEWLA